MNEPLAKRLAAYSATAAVTLALPPSAEAQVVYHDLVPDVEVHPSLPDGPYSLDFDDDGVTDLAFQACAPYHDLCSNLYNRYYSYVVSFQRPVGAPTLNGVLGYDAPYPYLGPSYGVASRFSSGDTIGPAGPGQGFYPYARAALIDGGSDGRYPFYGHVGYAGFQFVAGDGQLHYGWIRIVAFGEPYLTGRAYEWAYESSPETPILAASVSDALLDGDVSQATFPDTGGTLVYTVTVENTTDAPLPLDLWLDADGPTAFTRRLGSGTLPPGATVSRTLRVRVPATAPAGDYDVRFKLGHFATQQFITFERYAITKEVGTRIAQAENEGAFAVETIEGDLFSDADATASISGTHALSAPAPNPTDGRTVLTLEVAEAQAATVAVYDALGREVARLHDGPLTAGQAHRLAFDGAGLPAGIYAVRAVGESFSDTRVFTLAR